MDLWSKIIPLLFVSFASAGCAGPLKRIDSSPPKSAHLYITAEVKVSDVCFKESDPTGQEEPNVKCFAEKQRMAVGSGIHIRKYKNPRSQTDSSLILTAQHLCDVVPNTKREIISMYYNTRGWDSNIWKMAEKNLNLTTNPTVKWRFFAYDLNGIKYVVNPNIVALSNKVHDLCLLESERISHNVIPMASRSPRYGTRITNVSNPAPGSYTTAGGYPAFSLISEGFLVNHDKSLGILAVSDLNVTFGSSGSLLAVRRGNRWELVGMVFAIKTTAFHPYPPLYTIATSVETIKQFIDSEFRLYLKREAKIAKKQVEVQIP